jgi:hypothetical protein
VKKPLERVELLLQVIVEGVGLLLPGLEVKAFGFPLVSRRLTERLSFEPLLLAEGCAVSSLGLESLALQVPLEFGEGTTTSCHEGILF